MAGEKRWLGQATPAPCRSNAPSKQGQEQTMDSLVYMECTALANEINTCILDIILLHPSSTITVLGCVCLMRQPCGC